MDARRPRQFPHLLVVAGAALAARLLYFIELRSFPLFHSPTADTLKYLGRANEILGGQWLGEGVYFHSSPVYGYLLALGLGSGVSSPLDMSAVVWFQLLVSAATAVLTWAVGRELGGPRAGLVAGLVYALSPGAVFYDGALLADFLLPMTVASVALVVARGPPSPSRLFCVGAVIGFGSLARPNLLVFLAPVLVWARGSSGGSMRSMLGLVAGVSLFVLPVTARNALVGGDLVLISSNGGVNLFIGNGPDATGAFAAPPFWASALEARSTAAAEAAVGHDMTPSEVSRFYAGEAFGWIAGHPQAYLGLVARRMWLFISAYEVPNHMDLNYFSRHSLVLRGLPARWALVLPTAAAGLVWSYRRERRHTLLLLMCAVYAGSIIGLFFVTGRYRFPIMPILAIWTGLGVCAWRHIDARRRLAGAVVAGLVGVGAWATPPPEVVVSEAYSLMHLAGVHQRQGDHRAEIAALEAALEVQAPHERRGYLLNNLGIARMMTGDIDGALDASARALALAPDNAETLQNHVMMMVKAGASREALPLVEARISDAPGDAQLWFLRGRLLRETQELDSAVSALRQSISLGGGARAWFQLALCHEAAEDWTRAERAWQQGLLEQPDHPQAGERLQAIQNRR
ncbi:MAG: glycosyltransferase family 39 protein [Myxococcota bacterium]|nr:glycosyltransferase family 39 protein [Myxococcota bacterium]